MNSLISYKKRHFIAKIIYLIDSPECKGNGEKWRHEGENIVNQELGTVSGKKKKEEREKKEGEK